MAINENLIYAIAADNLYNIKLIVLSLLLFYSILAFLFKDRINTEKTYFHYWVGNLTKVFSWVYLIFSPLFYLFLLNYNITMEVFVLIIIAFYLCFTALFIGLSIYYGTSEIFRVFGFDDWNEFKSKYQEKKSMKKYG